jgi:hypothetical protein
MADEDFATHRCHYFACNKHRELSIGIHVGCGYGFSTGWQNALRESLFPHKVQIYLGRISCPLLDRVELQIEVLPVKFCEITSERTDEASAQILERVIIARRRQGELSGIVRKRRLVVGPQWLTPSCILIRSQIIYSSLDSI